MGITAFNIKICAESGDKNMKFFNLKKTVALFVLFFCLLVFTGLDTNSVASAQDASYGLNETMSVGSLNQALSKEDIRVRTGRIIGVILSFVGVIFLVLIIFAGIQWMTANGNDQQVNKSKTLMINAVIGLIIVFAAYAITAYIGDFLTGAGLTSTGK